ncbi:MAG: phosphoribosyltransferase family protein [Patescibacteria group bacterium]|nr:phosphoribosyltransferase [Patescibacteria group bacterium]
MIFENRQEAGKKLAEKLNEYAGRSDVLLFALPRGGVVLGAEVAHALKLPLDVIVTRKIGAPFNEEYAIGALAETGETVWNESERRAADPKAVAEIVRKEKQEAKRRIKKYRKDRALPSFEKKTVIIIDDGIATGLTMQAAIKAAQHQNAKKIVVAVPHGARSSIQELENLGAQVIASQRPLIYGAVGQFYKEFQQITDEEVLELLNI